ncbi:anti-sigma factor family protein [Nonomuraea roseola]|uniref:Zf-HC2 domain-containing protein n=1 Tax=Nonomuraea roseola TaxID=46179 RepID=A0ABV5PP89_9ACTN
MMTCEEVRLSLGAYTLGALDAEEAQEVEVHLASCEGCTDELMELEGLPVFLSKVSEKDVELVASPPREVLDRLLNDRVKRHRRGRLLLVAAASVAALAVGGTVLTTLQDRSQPTAGAPAAQDAPASAVRPSEGELAAKESEPRDSAARPDRSRAAEEDRNATMASPSASPLPSVSAELKMSEPGRAFTGQSKDVKATVTVSPGMPLQVQLEGVPPGTECRLVVVSKAGAKEVSAPWTVRAARYEAGAEVFKVQSRTPPESIRSFEVRDADGGLLVRITAK